MYIITFANVNIVFLICLNLSKLLNQTFLFVYGPMCISGDQEIPCQSEFVQLINIVDTGFVSDWLPTRIHKNIEHFEYHSIMFALAFATSLCTDKDPTLQKYGQSCCGCHDSFESQGAPRKAPQEFRGHHG